MMRCIFIDYSTGYGAQDYGLQAVLKLVLNSLFYSNDSHLTENVRN